MKKWQKILILALAIINAGMLLPSGAQAVTGNGERWYVRASNIDDNAYMYVNGKKVGPDVPYGGDSGWIDITAFVQSTGRNTSVRFLLWNGPAGYTYTFEIARQFAGAGEGRATVLRWSDGQAGVWGANNNDLSKTNRFVFDRTTTLTQIVGDNFGFPTDYVPTTRSNGYEGYAYLNWYYPNKYHSGADLGRAAAGYYGAPVRAAAAGRVVYRGFVGGWGNTIVIRHDFPAGLGTVYSQYSHLSAFTVENQANVSRGQLIGKVGSTGGNYAAHLHFEIKRPNAGGSLLGAGYYSANPNTLNPRYFDPFAVIQGY